jgi:hypothetical protein
MAVKLVDRWMFAALHWTGKKLELMSYAISNDERQVLAAGHRPRPEEACNLNSTLKSRVAESQSIYRLDEDVLTYNSSPCTRIQIEMDVHLVPFPGFHFTFYN